MNVKDRIIVALDYPALEATSDVVETLGDKVGAFKVGTELAAKPGWPAAIGFVRSRGGQVFADAKLHDIPATMGKTADVVTEAGPLFVTLHASAGVEAMRMVVKNRKASKVLGVTVLTSLTEEDSMEIYGAKPAAKVLQLGRMAVESGLDGLICSPQELEILASDPDTAKLLKVTPGIRPSWTATDDQKRIATPRQAIEAGATHLVIGRPITNPPETIGSRTDAVEAIIQELTV